MLGFAAGILADVSLGQLGETDREIDVCAWVVDAPASAVALQRVAKDDAAELEAPVEILRRRGARAEAESAASAELRMGGDGRTEENGKDKNGAPRLSTALHVAQCTIG